MGLLCIGGIFGTSKDNPTFAPGNGDFTPPVYAPAPDPPANKVPLDVVAPPEPPLDSSVPPEGVVFVPGALFNNSEPPDGEGVPLGLSSGAVTPGGTVRPFFETILKFTLKAPSPQSISPPDKIKDKLLEGVELQLPP